MKTFTSTRTIFTPGISGAGTIEFPDLQNFSIDRLIAIINQTQGALIYSTGSPLTRYTAVSGSIVTLFADTSSHQSGDVLQVIYNSADTDNGMLGIITDIAVSLKSILNSIVRPMYVSGNRVLTDGTVSTVTTVSAITNVTQLGSIDPRILLSLNNEKNNWANSVRRLIT